MPQLARTLIKVLLAILVLTQVAIAATSHELPRPAAIEPAVRFWTRVYTEIDTRHGFIHDSRNLAVVYQTIKLPSLISHRSNDNYIRGVKKHYAGILKTLASGKRKNLSKDEKSVLALFPKNVSNATLRDATGQLRFQLGQSDRFETGMMRSGIWRAYIKRTLQRMDLPAELIALPHVESSYNPFARSHIGASGMWQFTRSTGRRYLRVDHVVDERNDPFKSTIAAAQLLKYNYSLTENWALAITAYNHGVGGMRQARKKLGTDDIGTIIEKYSSRTFGFASRNFYASFLAAADIDARAEHYFGELEYETEPLFEIVEVPDYVNVASLRDSLDVEMQALVDLNPALQTVVWSGDKYVPRGYKLNVPFKGKGSIGYARDAMASLSPDLRYAAQKPDEFHKVSRGETISTIAARYKISQRQLAELNNLRSRHRIRVGQTLRLPQFRPVPVKVADNNGKVAEKTPIPDSGLYQVRSGDTLSDIANRFGLSTSSLMVYNRIDNGHQIIPGQNLRLKSPRVKQIVSKAASVQLASFDVGGADDIYENTPEIIPESISAKVGKVESDTKDPVELSVELSEEVIAQIESAEPTSIEEVELLGPSLTPGAFPAVSVDPGDYTVDAENSIEVQAVETLGHYADWLELPTNQLRQANRLRFSQALVIGMRLKLDFSNVGQEEFIHRRTQFHRDLQADFFAQNRIEETHIHTVKGGDSLWLLALERYRIPVWLLRQYNPDIKLDSVQPGTKVIFPRVKYTGNEDDTEIEDSNSQLS